MATRPPTRRRPTRAGKAAAAALAKPPFDPYDEWQAMPEYESRDLRAAYHVHVHFPTDTDADEFFRLIDRRKQKSIWWPQSDGHVGSDLSIAWAAVDLPVAA